MTLDWRDERTITAVLNYARIVVGVVLAGVLIYLYLADRVDLDAVLKGILSLITLDRVVQGMQGVIKAKRNGD